MNEFSLKTRWNIDDASWLAVNGGHWRAVHQLPRPPDEGPLDADRTQNPNPHAVDWHGWSWFGTATYHRDLACDGWFEAMAYYRLAHRALDGARPPAGPPFTIIRSSDSDSHNAWASLRGEFDAFLGTAHRIHWGARYHREWIDRQVFDDPIVPGPRVLIQDARTTTHVLSGNVDDTIELGRFTAILGVRGEWIVDSFGSDEVTDGKSYEFSDLLPGLARLRDRRPLGPVRQRERDDAGAAGLRLRLHEAPAGVHVRARRHLRGRRASGQGRLRAVGQAFLLELSVDSDFIEFDPILDVVTNHGGYTSRGVDLAVDVDFGAFSRRLRGLSVYGSVTHQERILFGPSAGNTPFQVPDWVAAGGVRYEHCVGVYGSVDFTHRGFAYVNDANDTLTEPYTVFGARVGWRRSLCSAAPRSSSTPPWA